MIHRIAPLRVEFVQGSLTDGRELVLVNASNTNGQLGTGVSAAIRRACGRIGRVRFYGFLAHELVPMARAVAQEYPEVLRDLPAEVRHGLQAAATSGRR